MSVVKKVSVWTCGCDVKYVTAGLEGLYANKKSTKGQRSVATLPANQVFLKYEVGSPKACQDGWVLPLVFVADL